MNDLIIVSAVGLLASAPFLNMNDLIIVSAVGLLASAPFFYLAGYFVGKRRGRDEQWVSDYLAYERKTQAGRDNLGRFKKRKAPYGKIKITAPKNES